MKVQAKRVTDYDNRDETSICYWKYDTIWMMHIPNFGLGNLAGHRVEEHEDGTISVQPSIKIWDGTPTVYHGYLTRGIWEDC